MEEDLRLALSQQGQITRRQLLALGVGSSAISYRVAHGKLFPSYPGVYGYGRPAQTPNERASAAVLACGPGAALSHLSALALWGFAGKLEAPFDVAVPGDRRPKGMTTHQLRGLRHRDLTTQLGIRTTSPARTLLDSAPKLGHKPRTRAINDALLSPYLSREALKDVVERNPRHHGARLLTPHIDTNSGPTRSEMEDDLPSFCRRFDLPVPLSNVIVNGYEADAYFPEHNVIVELDGWAFHRTRASFESDRVRDAQQLAHGVVTVRVTHQRMTQHAAAEAARLRRILQNQASRVSEPPGRSEPEARPSPRGSRATRAAPPALRPDTDPHAH